ncbi:MAG: hypothetical protein ABJL67_24625 [Sulfitobacter sp.]
MQHAPQPLLDIIAHWSDPAQQAVWICRTLFHQISTERDIGPLDETLKWGQPSWRPVRPRTGSTLRMGWRQADADHLAFFVDCKTNLAAQMQDIYPDVFQNDGKRALLLPLSRPFAEQAVAHLAELTFTYHQRKRVAAA